MKRTSRDAGGTGEWQVGDVVTKVGMRVMTATALLALVIAASVIWLVLTEPVRVAGVLADGEVRSVAQALVSVFAGLGRALLAWL
jgi:hypothetical protein